MKPCIMNFVLRFGLKFERLMDLSFPTIKTWPCKKNQDVNEDLACFAVSSKQKYFAPQCLETSLYDE